MANIVVRGLLLLLLLCFSLQCNRQSTKDRGRVLYFAASFGGAKNKLLLDLYLVSKLSNSIHLPHILSLMSLRSPPPIEVFPEVVPMPTLILLLQG